MYEVGIAITKFSLKAHTSTQLLCGVAGDQLENNVNYSVCERTCSVLWSILPVKELCICVLLCLRQTQI